MLEVWIVSRIDFWLPKSSSPASGEEITTKNIMVKKPNKCFKYMLLVNSSRNLHGNISPKKLPDIMRINMNNAEIFELAKDKDESMLYIYNIDKSK